MRTPKVTLSMAIARLEEVLAADPDQQPRAWAADVEAALSFVEQAVGRQDTVLESRGGGLDVDSGQVPSPGLDRKVGHLHDDLAELLTFIRDLRQRLLQVRNGVPEDGLYGRTLDLLDALERYRQDEARLIMETATTDIGAGD